MSPRASYLVGTVELALAIVGAVLLWTRVWSPAARSRAERRLPIPAITPIDLVLFLVFVLFGAFFGALLGSALGRGFGARGDAATILTGAGAQLGLLAGVALYGAQGSRDIGVKLAGREAIRTGAATFMMALPIMMLSAKSWELLLRAFGLPTERQDLIGMFANASSPALLAVMIALAVLIAPLGEELVFRAGLFRLCRALLPRALALILPAIAFAALHVNWSTGQGLSSVLPLTALAVIFSLAYERTGNIGTTMVAHALFNLNTVMLIFSGLDA